MSSSSLAYRPDIDGLRAVAILSVVAFHAFPELAPGGFVGVDIFFVISGYLITGILLHSLEGGRFSLVEFYARRIKRIFPALSLVLLSCLVFGWFALFSDEYKMLGKHTAASAAFIANLVLWREVGYFDVAAELKPLLHLWSLGIEEQFYIVWPAILYVAYRYKLNLLGLMLCIAIVSFFGNVFWVEKYKEFTFYFPLTRVWELLVGSLLAYLTTYKPGWIDAIVSHFNKNSHISASQSYSIYFSNNLKSGAGLLLIALSIFLFDKGCPFPGWWAIVPTMGAFLLIWAGPDALINRKILSSKHMIFIGLISFPVYLWHWPLLSYARILQLGTPSSGIRLAALVVSFFLAWLTYEFLEKRVRFNKNRFVTSLLILSLSLVGVLGYVINYYDGLGFRHHGIEQQLEPFGWDRNGLGRQKECTSDFITLGQEFCLRSKNMPISVALIGDSHANHLFYGLERYYEKSRQGVLNLGRGGCAPFYDWEWTWGGHADICREFNNQMLDYVLNEKNIKTVVLSGYWAVYVSKHGNVRFNKTPQVRDNLKAFGYAMDYTLERLIAAGKNVVFIFDIPVLDFDPKSCMNIRPLKLVEHELKIPCAIAKKDFDADTQAYRVKVLEILEKYPAVKRWDAASSLCDSQYCWAMKDGKMLYREFGHLSFDGSLLLGQNFAPR